MIDTKAFWKKTLDLAIRGKLVPQDPKDEPADVLLERIKGEKKKLVEEGKIKKEKPLPEIDDDEKPFEIPGNWVWTNLESITYPVGNKTNQIQIKDILAEGNYPVVSQGQSLIEGFSNQTEKVIHNLPLIMFGDHTRNVKYIDFPFVIGADGTKFHKCICVCPKYLYYWLKCTAFKLKNRNYARHYILLKKELVPLPPLSEQKRIVEKLEEISAQVNAIDAESKKLEVLATRSKNKILDLAIRGKLVPQDPKDEPAAVLLERIKEEKKKLVEEGKIKPEKTESSIFRGSDHLYYETIGNKTRCIQEEIPFEIPDNWAWVRLGTVFSHNTGKALNTSNRSGEEKQYITTSNLYWNRFELNKLKTMFFSPSEVEKCTVKKGDLLVCEGGDFGRSAIWNYDNPICIQNHIHRLRSYLQTNHKFYYYVFFLFKQLGMIGGKGIGIQSLSSNTLHRLVIPLPPLSEQKRIVEKLEELLPLYERLTGVR